MNTDIHVDIHTHIYSNTYMFTYKNSDCACKGGGKEWYLHAYICVEAYS